MIEVVSPAPVRRGVCFSVDRPCFVLEAPKPKSIPMTGPRIEYYKSRMEHHVRSVRDPDMNMSLNEIRTGIKRSDRMAASLVVYILGVLAIIAFR